MLPGMRVGVCVCVPDRKLNLPAVPEQAFLTLVPGLELCDFDRLTDQLKLYKK